MIDRTPRPIRTEEMINMVRDLDWGDVMDDAARMMDAYYDQMLVDYDQLDTPALQEVRYWNGIAAREGNDPKPYQIADYLLLTRINTTLCEGCLDRYGCMMCCPWDDGGLAEALNREAEEMALGRPLLPNEY